MTIDCQRFGSSRKSHGTTIAAGRRWSCPKPVGGGRRVKSLLQSFKTSSWLSPSTSRTASPMTAKERGKCYQFARMHRHRERDFWRRNSDLSADNRMFVSRCPLDAKEREMRLCYSYKVSPTMLTDYCFTLDHFGTIGTLLLRFHARRNRMGRTNREGS